MFCHELIEWLFLIWKPFFFFYDIEEEKKHLTMSKRVMKVNIYNVGYIFNSWTAIAKRERISKIPRFLCLSAKVGKRRHLLDQAMDTIAQLQQDFWRLSGKLQTVRYTGNIDIATSVFEKKKDLGNKTNIWCWKKSFWFFPRVFLFSFLRCFFQCHWFSVQLTVIVLV